MGTYLNQLLRDGLPLDEASIRVATLRIRTVLMTAMTTAFGLIPLFIKMLIPGLEEMGIFIFTVLKMLSALVLEKKEKRLFRRYMYSRGASKKGNG